MVSGHRIYEKFVFEESKVTEFTKHPARSMPFDDLYKGLRERVDRGLITVQIWRDLEMYTYSRDCQFDKAWDVFTLMARGLILCPSKKLVVATPMPKFFNFGEYTVALPDEPFEVTEKMDGSLFLAFFWDNEWWGVTKGSFQSEQAFWGTDWLRKNVKTDKMNKLYTYLFEVIYPANRIVVRYDFEGLVLLTVIAHTGEELTRHYLEVESEALGVRIVPQKQYESLDQMLAIAEKMDISSEGFVVRFKNGLRIKIKGSEYVRVHRLVSYCTPLAVWDMLRNKDDVTVILKDLPEEFHADFTQIYNLLQADFEKKYAEVKSFYELTKDMSDRDLGMKMPEFVGYSEVAKSTVFSARKKNWLEVVLEKPDSPTHLRNAFFGRYLRPTSNKLEGYKPSSVVNRFAAESAG